MKDISDIRIVWLETFIAVAELQSVTKAAQRLNISQSTASRNLARLDAALSRLLLTGDVPPSLTNDGYAFLPIAEQIVSSLKEWTVPVKLRG
ncbi:helix-turn-helix domain-containing protein [Alteriqipengyuania sp. 357]